MKTCSHCNEHIDDSARFCPICGALCTTQAPASVAAQKTAAADAPAASERRAIAPEQPVETPRPKIGCLTKDHHVLAPQVMDAIQAMMDDDAYFQQNKVYYNNDPLHLAKLKKTLHVLPGDRVILYHDSGVIIHGNNGFIVTGDGVHSKGLMEMTKKTTWYEMMVNAVNILVTNGTPTALRVKNGVVGYKQFADVIGDQDECADFWIRIKNVIAQFYDVR